MRAITNAELEQLRAKGQYSRLYLAVHVPKVVFQAQVNQTFDTLSGITQVTYDNILQGDYTDIWPDMELWVGTAPGKHDKGTTRVKSADSNTLYIAETSDIFWADNLYLTIVDTFGIWPRHIRVGETPNQVWMDYDVVYTDQHAKPDPVPVLGPDAVAFIEEGTAQASIHFDASHSWVLGGVITGYAWETNAGVFDDPHSPTPTLTVHGASSFYVRCTVTADNGKSFAGYRHVFVYNRAYNSPTTQFVLEQCRGSYETGGWMFRVRLWDEALLSQIVDRAKIILFADDWYGDQMGSLGPLAHRENIIAVGWIAGESITWDAEAGTVTFDVQGPQYWLNQIVGFPAGLQDHRYPEPEGGISGWLEFANLTVDKALWHLLHWRTTATRVMDIYLTDDEREAATLESPQNTLWEQIIEISERTILARPVCDRYGRLFVKIDPLLVPVPSRSWPVVMDLTKGDWATPIEFERRTVPQVGILEVYGITWGESGAQQVCIGTQATPKRYGKTVRIANLLLESEDQAEILAGLLLAKLNNPYPSVQVHMASNNRFFDITPYGRLTISLSVSDTPRGVVWNSRQFVVRQVAFALSEGNMLHTTLTLEAETPTGSTGNESGEEYTAPIDYIPCLGAPGGGGGGGGGGGSGGGGGGENPPGPPPGGGGGTNEDVLAAVIVIDDTRGAMVSANFVSDEPIYNALNHGENGSYNYAPCGYALDGDGHGVYCGGIGDRNIITATGHRLIAHPNWVEPSRSWENIGGNVSGEYPFTYALVVAHPSNPGELFIFGGCSGTPCGG